MGLEYGDVVYVRQFEDCKYSVHQDNYCYVRSVCSHGHVVTD